MSMSRMTAASPSSTVTVRRRRQLAAWMAVACAVGLSAPVSAQSLRLGADDGAGLVLANRSAAAMDSVRLLASAGWQIDCGSAPSQGLAAHGALNCAGMLDARRRSASAAASGLLGETATVAYASAGIVPLGASPGEGIVLVAGGAVHADSDSDGRLDAGEAIDFNYTIINLGDQALSGLTVSDLAGAVSCPQTTLNVGASMVCARAYSITASDQTAGLVANLIDVEGTDAAARPVGASDVVLVQNLAGRAALKAFKSPRIANDADANGVVSVGDLIRYTFVVKNAGAESLAGVTLVEPDPTRIDTAISCAATTLGGSAFGGLGSGSLASADAVLCTADYTVRASDAALRQVLNLAEAGAVAPVAGAVSATAASTVVVPVPPMIGVSKALVSSSGVGPGPYTVVYAIVVRNYGPTTLFDVQVQEDLRQTFPQPVGFSVVSVSVSGSGTANPAFNGESDTAMLNAAASTLATGATMTIQLTLSVTPGVLPGPFLNQVFASGRDSINQAVSDASVTGMNPDPDGDGVPNENSPTPITFNVLPPPAFIPAGNPAGLALLALLLLAGSLVALRRNG